MKTSSVEIQRRIHDAEIHEVMRVLAVGVEYIVYAPFEGKREFFIWAAPTSGELSGLQKWAATKHEVEKVIPVPDDAWPGNPSIAYWTAFRLACEFALDRAKTELFEEIMADR